MSIESMMPSNSLILCSHFLLLPSVFPSIGIFSSELAFHIRWPKDWSFTFSINASNEYLGLISLSIDWLDLLAVQGTLKSLQHHNLKVSILWHSAFFMVQLWHPYMTTGKISELRIHIFFSHLVYNHIGTAWQWQIKPLPKQHQNLGTDEWKEDSVSRLLSWWGGTSRNLTLKILSLQRHSEQTYGYQRRKGGGGMRWWEG